MSTKPRIVKDYEKLDILVQEQIKLAYPRGFHKHLVKFTNPKGLLVSALPFETDDRYYLVRMSTQEAKDIISDDDDYNDDGLLKADVQEELESKHSDDDDDDDDNSLREDQIISLDTLSEDELP